MSSVESIELTIYRDRTSPGTYIELIRYEPETDSFIIREYIGTQSGDISPLVSGHSLFRNIVERRIRDGEMVADDELYNYTNT